MICLVLKYVVVRAPESPPCPKEKMSSFVFVPFFFSTWPIIYATKKSLSFDSFDVVISILFFVSYLKFGEDFYKIILFSTVGDIQLLSLVISLTCIKCIYCPFKITPQTSPWLSVSRPILRWRLVLKLNSDPCYLSCCRGGHFFDITNNNVSV